MWGRYASITILVLLLIFSLRSSGQPAASSQVWSVLSFDTKDDGRDPSLPDAAQLSYRYDKQQDMLWFRVCLYSKPNLDAFGVNIVVDTGADDADKVNWWGGYKDFRFDKIVTAWVTRGDNGYQGTIGVGNAAGVKAKIINNLSQNNVQVRVEGDAIVLGVKRTDITDKMKMNLIAAVGSNKEWNDDIPNARSVVIDLAAPRPARGIRELDLGRNNFRFPAGYKTLAENQRPLITAKGRGREAVILIPGVYSGKDVFDGFIARNESRYRFYVVTPPGLSGTPARPLPPESTSYGEYTWTRRLERDVLELIGREKLRKPVIVAHGFPGSLVADEIAAKHPEVIGGIIDVAVMPVQFFASPRDPSLKKPATPEERVESVNEAWAQMWFKYVTPETWESNNYPVEMFSNDTARAEQVRQQVESAPLEVKIRYLMEFMASDHTSQFAELKAPLLAVIPGFSEKFLADPANSFYKRTFQNSWDPLSKNSQVQRVTIPDARALILDDQPKQADEAINTFVERVKSSPQANLTKVITFPDVRFSPSASQRFMAPNFLIRLKLGAASWNAWRRENPDLVIVLDGADLNGMILTGINFSRVSLRGASLHATNLMNADLRKADLTEANLSEADLIGARLEGTILTGANLHEADLRDADLTNAHYSAQDLKGALHIPG